MQNVTHMARGGWLLEIGQRLRVEFSVVEQPMPECLAALLKQLESADGTSAGGRGRGPPRQETPGDSARPGG